ncbi:alpha/beta-hydrolase, partial [Colletotrichum sublineola]
GTGDGQDGYNAIKEIAKLPWCAGKISLAGNSWLAVSQWFIAAQRPPHLACIAPLEGCSNHLQETFSRGGIPKTRFVALISNTLAGRNMLESDIKMLEKYPDRNAYWDDKRARMDRIQVPAYILGSYFTGLHTVGKWYGLYSKERIDDLQRFVDRYLKGIKNDWEQTPPVRLAVLGFNKPPILDLPFDHLPWHSPFAPTTNVQKLFLSQNKSFQAENDTNYGTLEYKDTETLELLYTFRQSTTLAGPTKLVIHTSCPSQTDFDIYLQLRKRDRSGNDLI